MRSIDPPFQPGFGPITLQNASLPTSGYRFIEFGYTQSVTIDQSDLDVLIRSILQRLIDSGISDRIQRLKRLHDDIGDVLKRATEQRLQGRADHQMILGINGAWGHWRATP